MKLGRITKKKYMVMLGDFNKPFSVVVKISKRKINKDIENLNNMVYKLDPMNITQIRMYIFLKTNMTHYQS